MSLPSDTTPSSLAEAALAAIAAAENTVAPTNSDGNSRDLSAASGNFRHGAFNDDVVTDGPANTTAGPVTTNHGTVTNTGTQASFEPQMVTGDGCNLATDQAEVTDAIYDDEVRQLLQNRMVALKKPNSDLTMTSIPADFDINVQEFKKHQELRTSMFNFPIKFAPSIDFGEISNTILKFAQYLETNGILSVIHYSFMKKIVHNPNNLIIHLDSNLLIKDMLDNTPLEDSDIIDIQNAPNLRVKMLLFFDKIYPVHDFIQWFEVNNKDCMMDFKAYFAYYVLKNLTLDERTYKAENNKMNDIFVIANNCCKRHMRSPYESIFFGCIIIEKFYLFACNIPFLSNVFPQEEITRRKISSVKLVKTLGYAYDDELGTHTYMHAGRIAPTQMFPQAPQPPIRGEPQTHRVPKTRGSGPRRSGYTKGFKNSRYNRFNSGGNEKRSLFTSSNQKVTTGSLPKEPRSKYNGKKKKPSQGSIDNWIYLGGESDSEDDIEDINVSNFKIQPRKMVQLNDNCLIDSGANRNIMFMRPNVEIPLYNVNNTVSKLSVGGNEVKSTRTATADMLFGNNVVPLHFIVLDNWDKNGPAAILSTRQLEKVGVMTQISGANKSLKYKKSVKRIFFVDDLPYVSHLFATKKPRHKTTNNTCQRRTPKYNPKKPKHLKNRAPGPQSRFQKQKLIKSYTASCNNVQVKTGLSNHHSSFGHISGQRINDTLKHIPTLENVRFHLSQAYQSTMLKASKKPHNCEFCTLSKGRLSTKAFKTNLLSTNIKVPLSYLNIDTFSFYSQKYLTVVDVYSKCIFVKLITPTYTVTEALISILNSFYAMGYTVTTIAGDNDKAFHSTALEAYYRDHHIEFYNAIPYFPRSNGLVERHQQILLNMIKAAVLETNPPLETIPQLMNHCAFMNNCTFHKAINTVPYEKAGIIVNVYQLDLTPLGFPVWYRNSNVNKGDKLYDNMLRQGIFLGRDFASTCGYQIWCCQRKIIITVNDFHLRQVEVYNPKFLPTQLININNIKAILPTAVKEVLKVPTFNMMKSDKDWLEAIHKEYDNLLSRQVLVETDISQKQVLQETKKIMVPLKWVMVYKGIKPKARLVLRGDFLKNKYDETTKYSPTISLEKVKTSIVTLLQSKYNFTICDVNQAFTLGSTSDYGIEVYSKLPAFYEINQGKSNYKTHTNPKGTTTKLLRLSKNLYGHPLAGIVFYKYLIGKAQSLGFEFVGNESCLLYNKKLDTFMLLYVDDVIIFDKHPEADERLNLIKELGKIGVDMKITLENSVNAKDFTFIGLTCSLKKIEGKQTISFHKPVDVEKFFKTLRVSKTKRHASTPFFDLMTHEDATTLYSGSVTLKSVQEFVGYVTYNSQHRPDIMFITNYLQIHLHHYNEHYLKIAGILLNYLYHNPVMKFTYEITRDDQHPIKIYTDSNHGGDFNRFSNGCIMIEIFGVLVLGKTSLNRIISISSTHAEIYTINRHHEVIDSIIDLAKEILSIALPSSKVIQPSIFIDNQAVIKILENDIRYKNKFQDIHISKFRHRIVEGNYGLYYIDTKKNIADIGTKPLPRGTFNDLLKLIGADKTNM